jgi:hypothetical protein
MFPVCFSVTMKVMSTIPVSGSGRMSGVGIGTSKKPSPAMLW